MLLRGLAGVVVDSDTMTRAPIYFDTPEWKALIEWLEFHGVDPYLVPAGSLVDRDGSQRCIRYTSLVVDEQLGVTVVDLDLRTRPMVEQGEAAPLPYPDIVQALLR